LEEHNASIVRIKEKAKQVTSMKQAWQQAEHYFMLVSFLAYSLILKMDSSEILIDFHQTT
jgi:hypothetical protein